jgi:hypothetical protein
VRAHPPIPATVVCLLTLGAAASAVRAEHDPVLEQLRLERAEMRLAHAEADLADHRRRLQWADTVPVEEEVARLAIAARRDTGAGDYRTMSNEALRHERALIEAEAAVRLRGLDLEEMRISGRMPADGLFAPLVAGRDFVGERQQVRLEALGRVSDLVQARSDMLEALLDIRARPWRDAALVADELEELTDRIETLELRMHLRDLHLGDALPPDAGFILEDDGLTRRERLTETRLERARAHVAEIEPLALRGVATQVDLDEAQAEVRRLEQRLESIRMERRFFDHRYDQWLERRARGGKRR